MKKVTLIAVLFSTFSAWAQFELPAYNPMRGVELPKPMSLQSLEMNRTNLSNAAAATPVNYHFDWLDMIVARDQNNGQTDSVKYYGNPLFVDSSANYNNIVNNVTSATSVYVMKAGSMVDPKSPNWDPTFSGNPIFSSTDTYTLDTIFVGARYNIVAGDNTPGDTLFFEIAYADTTTADFRRLNNKVLGFQSTVRENPSPNGAYGHHNFQQATANYFTYSYVLTAKDTVTVNNPFAGFIVFVLPNGGLKIPANNIFSVTYTFVPGANSNYKTGDAVFGYAGSSANTNGLSVVYGVNSGNAAHYYFFDEKSYYNSALDYQDWQQFSLSAKYGIKTFLDSVAYPQTQLAYDVIYSVAKTTVAASGIAPVTSKPLVLAQNYPNTCNSIAYIGYELPDAATTQFEIFDLTGKLVSTSTAQYQMPGNHTFELNTATLPAGLYFYTLSAGDSKITKRLTVIH